MLRTTLTRAVIRPSTTSIIGRRQSSHAADAAAEPSTKREGDISDSFASLSRLENEPLPDQFRVLKASLVQGHEEAIKASWDRLLERLKVENDIVAEQGSKVIPEIRFDHLDEDLRNNREEIKKRGAAVIRGVVPEDEARGYKFELEDYIRKNPQTKGFPSDNPQVWELYWSAPQLRARLHPNFLRVQTALMRHTWHTSDPTSLVSLNHPVTYADRLRMRQPGDAAFSLGPHQDGGSVERWMREGYGRGGTYDAVFAGKWDDDADHNNNNKNNTAGSGFDPWDASTRVDAVNDLYDGLGACSAFRMFQGWLSMSAVGPREGTLLVNPLLKLATSYSLLRPFFRPRMTPAAAEQHQQPLQGKERARFLDARNWEFTGGESMTSDIPGATPGYGMEFPKWAWHPHLELDRTMVHAPAVRPGDFVAWHCDTIHAVDAEHRGKGDSSVLYIPVCPTTELNAKYVAKMRQAWRNGTPGPDFPGGKGESEHIDRPDEEFVRSVTNADGLASMGLEPLKEPIDGSEGEKEVVRRVNRILGF